MEEIRICWIIPGYTQVRIVPSEESPLEQYIPDGEILSYDGQSNFPHATSVMSSVRQLQSALPNLKINASILNLAAVPRDNFINGTWEESYLSDKFKEVQFGQSTIEFRRIGMDIDTVAGLDDIINGIDLIIVPSSFETHVPEQMRIASYLRSRYGNKISLLASGTGVEGHETALLSVGYDVIFVGTISDRGEEVLESLVKKDLEKLGSIPGVFTNLNDMNVRNLGSRNFRLNSRDRGMNIDLWKERLPHYSHFVDIGLRMVGRPDLQTSINADSAIEYCCSMQDLPFTTIERVSKSGNDVVFSADEFFPIVGCPRECDFCHAAGKGSAVKELDYVMKFLDFYKKLGATDLIPTDDQVLLSASGSKEAAAQLIAVYEHAKSLGFSFFYGNGIEVYALLKIIEKSVAQNEQGFLYQKLFDLFCETASYIYLPYEDISALMQTTKPKLAKLSHGRTGFETVLHCLNRYAEKNRTQLEVGTNIIFSPVPEKEEMERYYSVMDEISGRYRNLNMRYNGFFMIPSECASHISRLRIFDTSVADQNHELKLVSIPTIKHFSEDMGALERRLAYSFELRMQSKSKRHLSGGGYVDV